jgi:hypothetical protein
MSKEFIKEAKNFRMQMKWCSIMCWATTAFLTYKAPGQLNDWGIIAFGAMVFTIIYFKMDKQIIDYENES